MKRFSFLLKSKFLNIFLFVLIVILSLYITHTFFKEGYFRTDDGEWAIVRLAEMKREIKDGQIPPRWSGFLNHGYGYPLFNFVYPFPYYAGLIPNLIGFNLTDSIKIIFVGSILASGIGMYLLGKYLRDETTGFIASIFYLSSPYRVVNLYQRGSLGEIVSGGLFPFLVLFFSLFLRKGNNRFYLLSSIFLFLLLISHNVSALFFLSILILISLVETFRIPKKRDAIVKRIAVFFISGFAFSSYFIIPALFEKKYIALSYIPLTDISHYFVPILSLLGIQAAKTGPFFQIGIFHIMSVCLILIIAGISIVNSRNKLSDKNKLIAVALSVALIIYIGMMTSISYPLWKLPLLSSVDFPWRLLGSASFLVAYICIFAQGKVVRIILTVLSVCSLVYILPHVQTDNLFIKNDNYYVSNDATTTSADELMPVWVKEKPTERYQDKIELMEGLGIIILNYQKSNYLQATIDTTINSKIRINSIYYPGWEYRINGIITKPVLNVIDGSVTLSIPKGDNVVEGIFQETTLRLAANIISICSALVMLIYVTLTRKRNI